MGVIRTHIDLPSTWQNQTRYIMYISYRLYYSLLLLSLLLNLYH
jgi:hypothetical protein